MSETKRLPKKRPLSDQPRATMNNTTLRAVSTLTKLTVRLVTMQFLDTMRDRENSGERP